MLTNATITRIDRKTGSDAAGRPRLTSGGAIAVRCAIDAVSSRQRYTLGAALADADQVVYIERTALQGEADPATGDRLSIQADHATAAVLATVITLGDRLGPNGTGLSHLELFVQRQPQGGQL